MELDGSGKSVRLPTLPSVKTTVSCKSWRGPNALGPYDLYSWTGRVTRPVKTLCSIGRERERRSVAGPGERAHLGAADEHEVVLAVGVVEVHRLLGLVVRGHAERHDLELRQATRAYSLLHVRRP